MKAFGKYLIRFLNAGTFTPEAFVFRAILLTLLYAISRMAGLAEYTAFLSGTSPGGNLSWQMASVLGLIHLLLHVAFILLVPMSLIAAVLLTIRRRWKLRRQLREE